jgi:LCP family protein required for cell wall assembly
MSVSHDDDTNRFRHPDALGSGIVQKSSDSLELNADGKVSRRKVMMPRAPRRRLRIGKFLLMLTILMIVGILIYVGFLISIVAKVSTNSLNFSPLVTDSSGRTNVLILGTGDPGHDGEGLTDTMMLMIFNSKTNQIAQISIPRDLRVAIAGHGFGKINSANAYGGLDLAKQTVTSTFNLPIDYSVTTDFSGLKDIVDAVGGIDVLVKEPLIDTQYPCDSNQYAVCGLNIQPGLQHMNGARTLEYVRCRKGTCGNDFGRAARQQDVLKLVIPKISDPHLVLEPNKLKAIAQAVQKSLKTDLGPIQFLELAQAWRSGVKNAPISFVLSTAPGGYLKDDSAGSSDLLPIGGNFSKISDKIQTIFQNGGH